MLQQTQVATVIPISSDSWRAFPTSSRWPEHPSTRSSTAGAGLATTPGLETCTVRPASSGTARGEVRPTRGADGAAGRWPLDRRAILALALDERHPILDGNVKRVLARYHRIDGCREPPGPDGPLGPGRRAYAPRPRRRLHPGDHGPGSDALRPRPPACDRCPLAAAAPPTQRATPNAIQPPAGADPARARDRDGPRPPSGGAVLLERRPPQGVWGGLWSLPECAPGEPSRPGARSASGCCRPGWSTGRPAAHLQPFPPDITPALVAVDHPAPGVSEREDHLWHDPAGRSRSDWPRRSVRSSSARSSEWGQVYTL